MIPPLLKPGSPITVDGDPVTFPELKGRYYTTDIHALISCCLAYKVPVKIYGVPSKGIRMVQGKGWKATDIHKTWLFDGSVSENEIYELLYEWEEILGDKMGHSAASTFMKLYGRSHWLRDDLVPYFRDAYSGGIEWSNPGVHPHVYIWDMREAYLWAMHKNHLTGTWSVDFKNLETITPNCLVSCEVEVTDRDVRLPLLPYQQSGRPGQYIGVTSLTGKGLWFGCELKALSKVLAIRSVDWILRPSTDTEYTKRFDLCSLPKPLRKRLSLVGYGIHAQAETQWEAVFAENLLEVASKYKTTNTAKSLIDIDGLKLWWIEAPRYKPFVRIDWAALITARVRSRMVSEAIRLTHLGEDVFRIYVDSIATTGCVDRTGELPGDWKLESLGCGVFGPPGTYSIDGAVKHAGVSIEYAIKTLQRVRLGTFPTREQERAGEY